MTKNYILPNIRTLLIEGFSDQDLRRLILYEPEFKPVHNKLAINTGKEEIVDRLLEYAINETETIEKILAWAKVQNERRYEKHQPYEAPSFHTSKESEDKTSKSPEPAIVQHLIPPAKATSITDKMLLRFLRVFLSYSSNDKPTIHALYCWLRADGIDAWFDKEKLLPGQVWELEIRKAVRAADIVLVCLSKSSINTAGYLQTEIRYALDIADEQAKGTIFLIPLKLEEFEIHERLSQWHWVNLFEEGGYTKLILALKKRARKKILALLTKLGLLIVGLLVLSWMIYALDLIGFSSPQELPTYSPPSVAVNSTATNTPTPTFTSTPTTKPVSPTEMPSRTQTPTKTPTNTATPPLKLSATSSPVPDTPSSTTTLTSPVVTAILTITPSPTTIVPPTNQGDIQQPNLTPAPILSVPVLKPDCKGPPAPLPPDGIDVGGKFNLCWTYEGSLAEDEYFDIKVRKKGFNDSAFVAWTKNTQYELSPWAGWTESDYILQIGVIKGYIESDKKHFVADLDRNSEALLIKWHKATSGGEGGSEGAGFGNSQ